MSSHIITLFTSSMPFTQPKPTKTGCKNQGVVDSAVAQVDRVGKQFIITNKTSIECKFSKIWLRIVRTFADDIFFTNFVKKAFSRVF